MGVPGRFRADSLRPGRSGSQGLFAEYARLYVAANSLPDGTDSARLEAIAAGSGVRTLARITCSSTIGILHFYRCGEEKSDQFILARVLSFSPGSEFHVDGKGGPYIRLAFGFARVADIHEGIARLARSIEAATGHRAHP